jgi:nucleoside-diphosphate-sugar epimerase
VPKYLAKALVYPVHLANVAAGNWRFTWDPKTVDAVTTDRAYSIEKARKELGYSPKYSLEDGLIETVHWYRQNGIVQ